MEELPAVYDHRASLFLVVNGLVDDLEEVEQRSCQFGCPIIWPLGVMELQHSPQLISLSLENSVLGKGSSPTKAPHL